MPRTARKRRPTIEDVARVSGVSRGTVSRVLNGGHWVSPSAKAAVDAAIAQTGFRINPHARSLVTARANSVASLLTETHDRLFGDPNFETLMKGAAEALAQRDITLVLIMAGSTDEKRRAEGFIRGGHVDGALLISSHVGKEKFLGDLLAADVPIISCGIPLGYEKKIGYVGADDLQGARDMVEYLRGRGRTRIAHITGPLDTSGGKNRLEGYRLQLGDDLDERLIAHGDYSRASGERAMRELLDREPTLDAVFAANDLMAAGALTVLQQSGRHIPGDVAVTGFDDSPVALLTSPPLTTMHQPFDRISHEMVRILLDVIEGHPAARVTMPTVLVERESA